MPDFKKALADLRAEREAKQALEQRYVNDPTAPFAGARSTPRDGELHGVVSAKSVEDQLAGEEWIKKPELAAMGRFNIIGASKRMTTFKRRTFEQTNFQVQLLDGDFRGCTAWVSFESNVVRDKIYNIVVMHGGVGPFILEEKESDDPERSATYIFVAADDESGANAAVMHAAPDSATADMTGEVEDTEMPFDAPAPSERKRKR